MGKTKHLLKNPLFESLTNDTAQETSAPERQQATPPVPPVETQTPEPRRNKSAAGLPLGSIRFTVVTKEVLVKKIKDLAYTKRMTIGDTFDEIINEYFTNHPEKLLDSTRRVNPEGDPEKYYTTNSAAEYLDIQPGSVRHAIKLGSLEAKRIGAQYVISEDELHRYAESPARMQHLTVKDAHRKKEDRRKRGKTN